MASIKQINERKYKITVSNGYHTDGRKISKTKTDPAAVQRWGILQKEDKNVFIQG